MSREDDRAESSKAEPKYGIRVEVADGAPEERSIGDFQIADSEGKLSVARVFERIHGTTMDGVKAVSYRIQSEAAGKLSPPRFWSSLSSISGLLIVAIFILSLFNPDYDWGVSIWAYYGGLAAIWLLATAMEVRKASKFIGLHEGEKYLEEIGAQYGEPVLDIPEGRMIDLQRKVAEVLNGLQVANPQKLSRSEKVASSLETPIATRTGETHGEAS